MLTHRSTSIYKKATRIFGMLFMTSLILAGCSTYKPKDSDSTPLTKAIDYFPIRQNTKYTYTGSGNEYASYTVFTDYTSQDKIQQRVDNGGITISEVIVLYPDKVVRSYFDASAGGRESFLNQGIQNGSEDEILLIDPIKQGTSWTLPDGSISTITNIDFSLTTDLGTYQTIEVENKTNQSTTKQYYAKEVGLIRTIYEQDEGDITSTLTAIDSNATYNQHITFFFPNTKDDSYLGITREVSFHTNDETPVILEQTYKSIVEESTSTVLTTNTHIESITRSSETTVTVDISESYYEELSAGSQYEAMIVQAFVNTIGQYYGVNEVVVTVGGKPYESGHISMQPKEAFKVDVTNVVYQ